MKVKEAGGVVESSQIVAGLRTMGMAGPASSEAIGPLAPRELGGTTAEEIPDVMQVSHAVPKAVPPKKESDSDEESVTDREEDPNVPHGKYSRVAPPMPTSQQPPHVPTPERSEHEEEETTGEDDVDWGEDTVRSVRAEYDLSATLLS